MNLKGANTLAEAETYPTELGTYPQQHLNNLVSEELRLTSRTIYKQEPLTCWVHAFSKVIRPFLSKLKKIHLTDEEFVSEIIKIHKQFFNNEHIKYTRKTDEYKSNAIDKYLENIGLICKYKEINSFDEAKKVLKGGYPLLISDRSFGKIQSYHMVVGNAIDEDDNILYISSIASNNNVQFSCGLGKYSKKEFIKKLGNQLFVYIMECNVGGQPWQSYPNINWRATSLKELEEKLAPPAVWNNELVKIWDDY